MPTVMVTFVKATYVLVTFVHMANIHQDGNSIRNIQVVSSNRVHSTHLCEANKCQIFKPFFVCFSDKRFPMLNIKKMKKINLMVRFLSSANEVSTGPTCQFLSVCLFVCLSVCVSFRSFFQGV